MSYIRRFTPLQFTATAPKLLPRYRFNPPLQALHSSARRSQQQDEMAQERPTGLKANKGIELLTFGTPNGVKASILLEELKETYGKVRNAFIPSQIPRANNGAGVHMAGH